MKLGEVVVNIEYYNFNKFHYILMKKIIVFYQIHLTRGRGTVYFQVKQQKKSEYMIFFW